MDELDVCAPTGLVKSIKGALSALYGKVQHRAIDLIGTPQVTWALGRSA